MLKMHLSYKPPSSWRILFLSGGYPKKFSCLKYFRSLVVPDGGFHKGIILQGRQLTSGLPVIGQSRLRIKGEFMGASVYEFRKMNSMYVQTIRRSIYEARRPEQTHLTKIRYQCCPQIPTSWTCYKPTLMTNTLGLKLCYLIGRAIN